MVGFQESINLVKENLRKQDHDYTTSAQNHDTVDHGKILRDYDELMREHERRMDGHRRHVKRHGEQSSSSRQKEPSSMRFRFKSDSGKNSDRHSTKSRRHRSRDYDEDGEISRNRRHRTRTRSPKRHEGEKERGEERQQEEGQDVSAYAAHPFARPIQSEYLDPAEPASLSPPSPESLPKPPPAETTFEGPDDAFRASLFDAMADDEGAAYWESVYGEPIHVYTRPTVQTSTGELEQMTDDEYADYVKRRMWEKKNPELVKEREDRARRELEKEENKPRWRRSESTDSDYEWVGNEEKGYERRRVRGKPKPREKSGRERNAGFMNDVDAALARGAKRREAKKWQQAWTDYHQKWQDLTADAKSLHGVELAVAIPWPVISGTIEAVSRENIQDFFRNCTLRDGETRMALLKAERFRWHPDKIQHRFGGDNVDTDTLALVTSVFQTIDELMAQEKDKEARH